MFQVSKASRGCNIFNTLINVNSSFRLYFFMKLLLNKILSSYNLKKNNKSFHDLEKAKQNDYGDYKGQE